MFWVCVCSLRCRGCNAHAPYCHLWPVWLYIFPKLSHKRHDFRWEKNFLNTKCVFWFSVHLLCEKFLILMRNERDMRENVCRVSREVAIFLWDFNETRIFWTGFFFKTTQIPNLMKIRPFGAELFHAERWTDGRTHMTIVIIAFRNFV